MIFDEVTSGWRMNVGGIHALYKVTPDIAVYGKAMSNGYSMAAIIGKKEVMGSAQEASSAVPIGQRALVLSRQSQQLINVAIKKSLNI